MENDNYKTGVTEFDERFEWLSGDTCWEDYGGTWYRKIDESRFQVVSIFNWEDAVGEREAEEVGETHHLSLNELDLSLPDDCTKSALDYCGYYKDEDGAIVSSCGDIIAEADDKKTIALVMCEAMNSAGVRAELASWNGSDLHELFKNAADESQALAGDEEYFESRMNSPGNRLRSTHREMMEGDIHSGMMRGVAKGDPKAQLFAKIMHGPDSLPLLEELAKLQEL